MTHKPHTRARRNESTEVEHVPTSDGAVRVDPGDWLVHDEQTGTAQTFTDEQYRARFDAPLVKAARKPRRARKSRKKS